MKIKIIALITSCALSIPAIAAEASANFVFGAEQEITCSLSNGNDARAPIYFGGDKNPTSDYWASAEITSDLAKTLTVRFDNQWTDKTAWAGKDPDDTIFTKIKGSISSGETSHSYDNKTSGEENYVMPGLVGQSITYSMAVEAEDMTATGVGKMNSVINFFCE